MGLKSLEHKESSVNELGILNDVKEFRIQIYLSIV